MTTRKKDPKEFKLDAVSLVLAQEYTKAEASRSLGINPNLIARWIQEHQAHPRWKNKDASTGSRHEEANPDLLRRDKKPNKISASNRINLILNTIERDGICAFRGHPATCFGMVRPPISASSGHL
jgi:transposase-like protein